MACLAFAVYANALDNPFVYDDHDTVISNRSLIDPSNVRFVLVYSPFRPVVNASYAIDRAIWGYRPFGFHLTSVLLHALVSVLLYVLLLRALADSRERRGAVGRDDPGHVGGADWCRVVRGSSPDDRGRCLHVGPVRAAVRLVLPRRAPVFT